MPGTPVRQRATSCAFGLRQLAIPSVDLAVEHLDAALQSLHLADRRCRDTIVAAETLHQLGDTTASLGHDNPELRGMASERVNQLGPLLHQALSDPQDHRLRLALERAHGHDAHPWPPGRVLVCHIAEVRGRQNIRHVEQRMAQIAQGFLLVDVHRRHPGLPRLQRCDQRPGLDERRAARVHQECRRLHAGEVRAARLVLQHRRRRPDAPTEQDVIDAERHQVTARNLLSMAVCTGRGCGGARRFADECGWPRPRGASAAASARAAGRGSRAVGVVRLDPVRCHQCSRHLPYNRFLVPSGSLAPSLAHAGPCHARVDIIRSRRANARAPEERPPCA
jgi:hypothetical protein